MANHRITNNSFSRLWSFVFLSLLHSENKTVFFFSHSTSDGCRLSLLKSEKSFFQMEVYLLLVLFFCPTLISSIPVRFYTNAWYEPATASDLLVTLTSITTFHQCACQCYNYSSCLTGAFSNINQTCSLYSLSINSSELRWTFDEFSFVFDFLTKTPATPSSMEWNFNQTFNDKYSVYNGQLISNSVNRKKRDRSNQEQILWISSAFNEGDTAVQFLSNSYCLINPTFNFNPTSFTITARIYIPTSLVADAEYFPLFSHCQSLTIDHCLYAVVEKNGLRLGFYNDDLVGQTPLNANQWYHVAFVYDQAASEQRVYLNGILDGSRKSNASYAGGENHIILGPLLMMSNITFLNGYIEKITFDSYVKTESELLTDATSVAYYPFDNSYLDAGPDHVDNTLPVSTTFYANGHLHQALLFNSETSAYFRIIGLFYLGLVNYPFSISLWISPFSSSGTILQVIPFFEKLRFIFLI